MRDPKRSFLTAIYTHCFFDELVFIYPYYAVMFSDCGLSAVQISVLFIVWSVVGFALEIPSGALADRYPRKHVLIFGQFAKLACCLIWLVFPSFWGFLAGFACWGVKGAFASGAWEAMIYDELKHRGSENEYARLIGRLQTTETVAVVVASAVAPMMLRFGYSAILAASAVSLAISIVALLFVHPAKGVHRAHENSYLVLLRQGVVEAIGNKAVLGLLLFISFGLVIAGALEEYDSLFLRAAGVPLAAIGPLCAAVTMVRAVMLALAYKLIYVSDRALYAAYLASGALLVIAAYLFRPASVVGLAIFGITSATLGVVFGSRLQDAIRGEARATTLSVGGFLTEIGAVHVYLGFGAIATLSGYRAGYAAFGFIVCVLGAVCLAVTPRGRGGTRKRRAQTGRSPFEGQVAYTVVCKIRLR